MSELTNIHARAVKDLTTPTELPVDTDALDKVKLVAGNFPAEYAGNEALTVKQIKDLATVDLESKKANKTDVEVALSNLSTTANKFYPTLSEANSHLATMSVNAVVTIGEEANKGLWYKATAGATTLTKSAYDPLTQANNYTNNKAIATKTEAVAIAKNYTDLVFDAVPTVIAPYVAQAEAAATVATIGADVFDTPDAGVDPVTGVDEGAYFNVRSSNDWSYIDEYQNIGGVATPSGKSYPSGAYIQNIVKYTARPFVEGKTYSLNERVQLANGDIVKSNINANTNNPNVDMTGWVKVKDAAQLEYSLLKNKITRAIYDKLYETWSIKDFGAIGDGTLHTLQEWVDQGKFSGLAAIQVVFPFVTSLTESIDRVAIQAAIKALPLNTADVGILTPKGFANGGCIKIPRGRYIIDKKVTMQRGLQLVGEGRESSQLISFISNESVLQYADSGRYIQDEIVIKNLSIWQDPSVTATAGAAIDVIEGAAAVLSLYMNIDNVYIEGTYYGIRHMAGVGSAIRNSNISKCVNHGVYLTGVYSTTSTVFENTYSHQNGGDGFNIEKGAYIAFVACASDSNTGFGYRLNQTRGYSFVGCGAEVNQKAALNLVATGGGDINLFAISNLEGVAKLESNVGTVKFSGGDWEGTGFAIRNIGVSKVHLDGTVLAGDYATNRSDAIAYLLDESSNSVGKLVGGTKNQWAIGVRQQPDSDGGFTVGGVASNSTVYGFKSNQQFNSAGVDRNAAMFSQFVSTDTPVTYPLAISHFVLNASKGTASTIQRSAGTYIQDQTRGAEANANIMIDGGQGTVPFGNWSIYNGSAKPNYFGGSLTWKPATSATPANNGDLTFEKTSDTQVKIKVKGSDGVVRSVTLTLA